ncbi:Hypothetical predicted protein [Mytilus galloprovincialis]|uniref:CCHC-type domain-containing protein n=1 Tax=Mytilus galloprovincialis TaxID=29158 RepID=A0A8B6GCY9_MYTGA|nr:Hypothetical predicted protein [Mytilus galloprovincialis]
MVQTLGAKSGANPWCKYLLVQTLGAKSGANPWCKYLLVQTLGAKSGANPWCKYLLVQTLGAKWEQILECLVEEFVPELEEDEEKKEEETEKKPKKKNKKKNQDVHGSEKPPRAQWLTNVEIFKSISAKVPKQCIKGIQRIREMWRIYMDNEGDRLSLLVQGLNLRGRQVPLHSQNPHNPSTLQKDTIRIKVKNIPLSADDGQIHRALTLQGCEIQGLFREYLRIDGKMTACETGDRLVISKTLDKPIPRNLPIGRYFGRIFHAGQPEFQNNNTGEREERTCHKCLKPGHMLFQCPNDWVCKICKESGHKMIDCPKHFQTVDEHDHDEARQQPENDNIASVDNTDQDENVDHTELEVPTIPPAKKHSGKKEQ